MSPASARALRRRRVADLRAAEPGLSLRQMARRLGVSRDTVRRDLDEIDQGVAELDEIDQPDAVADAGSAAGAAESAPVADAAPQVGEVAAAPVAQDRPLAGLPRRVAQPLAGVDLSQWRAARRDLAILAQTGRSAEALAQQAITAVAHHYARALARGDIRPGQPFHISSMTLRTLPRRPGSGGD